VRWKPLVNNIKRSYGFHATSLPEFTRSQIVAVQATREVRCYYNVFFAPAIFTIISSSSSSSPLSDAVAVAKRRPRPWESPTVVDRRPIGPGRTQFFNHTSGEFGFREYSYWYPTSTDRKRLCSFFFLRLEIVGIFFTGARVGFASSTCTTNTRNNRSLSLPVYVNQSVRYHLRVAVLSSLPIFVFRSFALNTQLQSRRHV